MNKHYENIHRYDFLTKEFLQREYVENGLTDKQIATKYNMPSKVVVWRKRKKFGIENKYTAKSNKHANKNRKYNLTLKKAKKILSEGKIQDIADYLNCSIVVAKRRLKELGLSKEQNHTDKYKYWNVELTSSQKQMIMGSTLGDGTLTKHGAYSCSHSHKYADYHRHKREALSSIHSGKFREHIHNQKDVNGVNFKSITFTTCCNQYCHQLHSIFYPNGKKEFPYDFLIKNIEAEGIAYWYMDDGCIIETKHNARLCTYALPFWNQLFIQRLFNLKFGIKTKIRYERKRNNFLIIFPATSTSKLIELIRSHIIPSMMYKIDYKDRL